MALGSAKAAWVAGGSCPFSTDTSCIYHAERSCSRPDSEACLSVAAWEGCLPGMPLSPKRDAARRCTSASFPWHEGRASRPGWWSDIQSSNALQRGGRVVMPGSRRPPGRDICHRPASGHPAPEPESRRAHNRKQTDLRQADDMPGEGNRPHLRSPGTLRCLLATAAAGSERKPRRSTRRRRSHRRRRVTTFTAERAAGSR